MRPLEHVDLTDAARALLAQPPRGRRALCTRLLDEADWADAYARRLGKPHALWGDGTLSGAARQRLRAPEPRLNDVEYCSCLEMVLRAILDRKAHHRMR